MTIHQSGSHSERVVFWESENCEGLAPEEVLRLFARAINAIEDRSRVTLSNVTVMAVVERVIHESKEKYPVLSGLALHKSGMDLKGLAKNAVVQDQALRKALRLLLIHLLTVLSDITAGILSEPLHKELNKIKSEHGHAESSVKTNRDEK